MMIDEHQQFNFMLIRAWKRWVAKRSAPAEPGTVISASLAPSGKSALTIFFFSWGIFWALYWFGTMLYGLLNGSSWEQQQLSYHMAMGITTLIMMGIIYLKFVLPDTIIVKHSQNKYIPEHQKDWREYKW